MLERAWTCYSLKKNLHCSVILQKADIVHIVSSFLGEGQQNTAATPFPLHDRGPCVLVKLVQLTQLLVHNLIA